MRYNPVVRNVFYPLMVSLAGFMSRRALLPIALGIIAVQAINADDAVPRAKKLWSSLPIVFEPNAGRWDPKVKFSAKTSDYRVLLSSRGVEFTSNWRPSPHRFHLPAERESQSGALRRRRAAFPHELLSWEPQGELAQWRRELLTGSVHASVSGHRSCLLRIESGPGV